jgi:hypothetical protein
MKYLIFILLLIPSTLHAKSFDVNKATYVKVAPVEIIRSTATIVIQDAKNIDDIMLHKGMYDKNTNLKIDNAIKVYRIKERTKHKANTGAINLQSKEGKYVNSLEKPQLIESAVAGDPGFAGLELMGLLTLIGGAIIWLIKKIKQGRG